MRLHQAHSIVLYISLYVYVSAFVRVCVSIYMCIVFVKYFVFAVCVNPLQPEMALLLCTLRYCPAVVS